MAIRGGGVRTGSAGLLVAGSNDAVLRRPDRNNPPLGRQRSQVLSGFTFTDSGWVRQVLRIMQATSQVSSATFEGWALCLARKDASSLEALRLEPGAEVAETGDSVWLRGKGNDPVLARRLRALPAVDRYDWRPPDRLRRAGSRIPCDRLPALTWIPLARWLDVRLPGAALPGVLPPPMPLRLVRSGAERPAALLKTSFDLWQSWALSAPRVRLARLRFAVNATWETLVWGVPLPPIPGLRYTVEDRMAVPSGFDWDPSVEAGVLRRLLGAGADTLILWREDGRFIRLHEEQFVPATPAAVRATALETAGSSKTASEPAQPGATR